MQVSLLCARIAFQAGVEHEFPITRESRNSVCFATLKKKIPNY